jgi:phage tail sheath gpL-like
MALTSIGSQKTPGRPIEITFAPELGLPSDSQQLLLIGHAAPGATGIDTVISINNVADVKAAREEAELKFGVASELSKMVVAAVEANQGGGTFPAIKCVPLESTETSIPQDAVDAINAARLGIGFIVSPYDLQNDAAERVILKNLAQAMSGAQRVENQQFGTFGVGANFDEADPSLLEAFDTQFLIGIYKRDSAPTKSLGETAARCAARMAANGIPFNPLDDVSLVGEAAPVDQADWISVGAGLESEVVLSKGWTPLWVKPNSEVAFVRTVTGRISTDGTGDAPVTAYYDVQDFQTLYFWRRTLYTRFSQPDFKQRKASEAAALEIKGEAIRLASTFEDQGMFQAVGKLAKKFQVERNISDRHRFDVLTPVNVIPGLHVIATNILASTEFDVVSV